MERILIAGEDDGGRRLDRILRKALPDTALSLIYRLLRQGLILLDGRKAAPDARVLQGQRITLPGGIPGTERTGGAGGGRRRDPGIDLEKIILRQDQDLLVLDKPAGLPVHGPGRNLGEAVRAWLAGKTPASLSFVPGPLHRLDRPASGVIVFSASLEGARVFSALMRERRLKKTYLALAEGEIIPENDAPPLIWKDFLIRDRETGVTRPTAGDFSGGKNARTLVRPLMAAGGHSLLALEIETGRTHQIRSQASLHGHPLAGDRKYGGGAGTGGPFLHAWRLEFPQDAAAGNFRGRAFTAPLPLPFREAILRIFGKTAIKNCKFPALRGIIE